MHTVFRTIIHRFSSSQGLTAVFLRFACSSTGSAVIDLCLFELFCLLFAGLSDKIAILLATILARVISSVCNYLINRVLVFQSNADALQSGSSYAILTIAKTAASAFSVSALYQSFGGSKLFWKILMDVTLFFVSFLCQKLLIFKQKRRF